MVIISSLVFAAVTLLALSAIALSLTSAMPRIRQITDLAFDRAEAPMARRITISVPQPQSADIIQLSNRNSAKPRITDCKEAA